MFSRGSAEDKARKAKEAENKAAQQTAESAANAVEVVIDILKEGDNPEFIQDVIPIIEKQQAAQAKLDAIKAREIAKLERERITGDLSDDQKAEVKAAIRKEVNKKSKEFAQTELTSKERDDLKIGMKIFSLAKKHNVINTSNLSKSLKAYWALNGLRKGLNKELKQDGKTTADIDAVLNTKIVTAILEQPELWEFIQNNPEKIGSLLLKYSPLIEKQLAPAAEKALQARLEAEKAEQLRREQAAKEARTKAAGKAPATGDDLGMEELIRLGIIKPAGSSQTTSPPTQPAEPAEPTVQTETTPPIMTRMTANKVARQITGGPALPAVLLMIAKNQQDFSKLIEENTVFRTNPQTGKAEQGFREGSIPDSLQKFGIDPITLNELLPALSGVIELLPQHQQAIHSITEGQFNAIGAAVAGGQGDLVLDRNFYDNVGSILFGKNGIVVPLAKALKENPQLTMDLLEKSDMLSFLKPMGIDLKNEQHRQFVTDLIIVFADEIERNPQSQKDLEAIIKSLGNNYDQGRGTVYGVRGLLQNNPEMVDRLSNLVANNFDVVSEIAVDNPTVGKMLSDLKIDVKTEQGQEALQPVIQTSLALVTEVAKDNSPEANSFFTSAQHYMFNPNTQNLNEMAGGLAIMVQKNDKMQQALLQLVTPENLQRLNPVLAEQVKGNKAALRIINDQDLLKGLLGSFLNKKSLPAIMGAVEDLSKAGVIGRMPENSAFSGAVLKLSIEAEEREKLTKELGKKETPPDRKAEIEKELKSLQQEFEKDIHVIAKGLDNEQNIKNFQNALKQKHEELSKELANKKTSPDRKKKIEEELKSLDEAESAIIYLTEHKHTISRGELTSETFKHLKALQDKNIILMLQSSTSMTPKQTRVLFESGIKMLQASKTSEFLNEPENKAKLADIVRIALKEQDLDPATKTALSENAPALIEIAASVLTPQNLEALSKLGPQIEDALDPNKSAAQKIESIKDIAFVALKVLQTEEMQTFLKDDQNKAAMAEIIDSFLPLEAHKQGITGNAVVAIVENPEIAKELDTLLQDDKAMKKLTKAVDNFEKGKYTKGAFAVMGVLITSPSLRHVVKGALNERSIALKEQKAVEKAAKKAAKAAEKAERKAAEKEADTSKPKKGWKAKLGLKKKNRGSFAESVGGSKSTTTTVPGTAPGTARSHTQKVAAAGNNTRGSNER